MQEVQYGDRIGQIEMAFEKIFKTSIYQAHKNWIITLNNLPIPREASIDD